MPSTPSWPRWAQPQIIDFDHEAKLLPNGDTAVIATTPKTVDVQGEAHHVHRRHGPRPGPELPGGVGLERLQVAQHQPPRHGSAEVPSDWLHANSVSWSPEDGDLIVSLRSPGLGDQDRLRQRDRQRPHHLEVGAGGNFTAHRQHRQPVVLPPARRAPTSTTTPCWSSMTGTPARLTTRRRIAAGRNGSSTSRT